MNKLVLEKHQEWSEEIKTFSNTFLISVAIDHKKRESIIVVLENIFSATDAKELLIEYQRLEQMVRELRETGGIEAEQDYSGGFAEKFSK